MNKKNSRRDITRRTFLKSSATAIALGTFGKAPIVLGQAKKFKGVTINGACFQHVFGTYLKEYLPEFEEKTGAPSSPEGAHLAGALGGVSA